MTCSVYIDRGNVLPSKLFEYDAKWWKVNKYQLGGERGVIFS
jgi:hypothetical protein